MFGTLTRRSQDELRKELEDLEQDKLNEMLQGAEPAPMHIPPGAVKTAEGGFIVAFAITHEVYFPRMQQRPRSRTKKRSCGACKPNSRCDIVIQASFFLSVFVVAV